VRLLRWISTAPRSSGRRYPGLDMTPWRQALSRGA